MSASIVSCSRLPSVGGCSLSFSIPADAVDDDVARALFAHQLGVVNALDAGLPDDGAGAEAGELRPLELRFLDLADVAEEVAGEAALRIRARRHFLDDDLAHLVGARQDGEHLLLGRVLDDGDRPEDRLAAAALDDLANLGLVHARHLRQLRQRGVEVGCPFAVDRDRPRVAVLDEDLAVAIEEDAARRAQRDRAQAVVVRHLPVLLVLHDLQQPEADGQRREADDRANLQRGDPRVQALPIFVGARVQHHHCLRLRLDRRLARPRAIAPGRASAA
jgi:hypothetical protein